MLCLLMHRSLPLLLFIFVTENRELCHSFHYHSYIRKSLNHFRSCLSNDKKLFSALNFPRTSSGTMQRNNYLPRSNPRTKKGGTRFHICMLQGNASLILIPRRMLIRLPVTSVCEQTGCANWCCNELNGGHKFGKSSVTFLSFFIYFFLLLHC